MPRRSFLCFWLLLALPPAALAQVQVEGAVVAEETGQPIGGALVEVFDRRGTRVARHYADDNGIFRLVLKRQGGYRFRAGRLGYEATTTPVLWTDGHDWFQVEIRLHPEAILLAPLEVLARSGAGPSPVLSGFHARRSAGVGHFITREEIERIQPGFVTDLLARVPGVRLESSGYGTRRRVYMTRGLGAARDCAAQVFLDGFLLNRRSAASGEDFGLALDDAVTPASVEGIEVYSGVSSVPAEFLSPEARCGVVVVWTRRGG